MKKRTAVFSFLWQLAVFSDRCVYGHNVLHFNAENSWIGAPVAVLETTPFNSAVIYEARVNGASSIDSESVLKLARATLKHDGITWRMESDFLDGAKLSPTNGTKLSPTHDRSVSRGGVLRNPRGRPADYYAVAYSSFDASRKSGNRVHTTVASKDFAVSLAQKGYEAEGIHPSLFEYNQTVYVAYLTSESNCTVQIAKAKSKATLEGEIKLPDDFRRCSYPQLFQVKDNYFALAINSEDPHTHTFRPYYFIGQMTGNKGILFSYKQKWCLFDFGHAANSFAFSEVGGQMVAIGRVAHTNDPTASGLTLLRKISFDPELMRLKQDPFINSDSKLWSEKIKGNNTRFLFNTNQSTGEEAILLELNYKKLTAAVSITFEQIGGRRRLDVSMRAIRTARGWNFSLEVLGLERQLCAAFLMPGISVKADWRDSSGLANDSNVKPTLKVVFDKSTIEVYGLDGYLVVTENFAVSASKPLSKVAIAVSDLVELEGSITGLRGVAKEKKQRRLYEGQQHDRVCGQVIDRFCERALRQEATNQQELQLRQLHECKVGRYEGYLQLQLNECEGQERQLREQQQSLEQSVEKDLRQKQDRRVELQQQLEECRKELQEPRQQQDREVQPEQRKQCGETQHLEQQQQLQEQLRREQDAQAQLQQEVQQCEEKYMQLHRQLQLQHEQEQDRHLQPQLQECEGKRRAERSDRQRALQECETIYQQLSQARLPQEQGLEAQLREKQCEEKQHLQPVQEELRQVQNRRAELQQQVQECEEENSKDEKEVQLIKSLRQQLEDCRREHGLHPLQR